jgi:hypothetical protein
MRNYYIQCLFLFLAFFTANIVFSQVGIGNTNPKATLDVTAKYPTGTLYPNVIDGLTVPTLTLERVQSMSTTPANILTSTMIYVDNVTGTPAGVTANITSVGPYYWDGAAWQSIKGKNTTTISQYVNLSMTNNSGTNTSEFGFLIGTWTPASNVQRLFFSGPIDSGIYHSQTATTLSNVVLNGWISCGSNATATLHIVKYSLGTTTVAYAGNVTGTSLGSQTYTITAGNMNPVSISIPSANLAAGDALLCVLVNSSGATRTLYFGGQLQFNN